MRGSLWDDNTTSGHGFLKATSALTVNSPPEPLIALSTSSISAAAIEGSNPPSQTFTVRNSGTGTLVYLVSDNREWMTCTLIDGDGKSTGESETIRVDFLASSLNPGMYSGQITVYNYPILITPVGGSEAPASNSPQTISVSLTIDPPPSPPNINHLYEFGIEEWPGGNNNGLANVGEWVKVQFRFRNNGSQTAHNIGTTLQISVFDYNYCYIADKTVARGSLSPGLSKRSGPHRQRLLLVAVSVMLASTHVVVADGMIVAITEHALTTQPVVVPETDQRAYRRVLRRVALVDPDSPSAVERRPHGCGCSMEEDGLSAIEIGSIGTEVRDAVASRA